MKSRLVESKPSRSSITLCKLKFTHHTSAFWGWMSVSPHIPTFHPIARFLKLRNLMTLLHHVMVLFFPEQCLIYTIYCKRDSCYPEPRKCALEPVVPCEGASVAPCFAARPGVRLRWGTEKVFDWIERSGVEAWLSSHFSVVYDVN